MLGKLFDEFKAIQGKLFRPLVPRHKSSDDWVIWGWRCPVTSRLTTGLIRKRPEIHNLQPYPYIAPNFIEVT